MASRKNYRDTLSGEYASKKKATKRPARFVAETRAARRPEAVMARFTRDKMGEAEDMCLVEVGAEGMQSLLVPRKSLPKDVVVGDRLKLRLEKV